MPGTSPGMTRKASVTASVLPHHADVDLALDIGPLFGGAQHRHQLLELRGMFRRIFEPGQEIEGFAEVAAVIELPRDCGQIFQAARDMMRLVLKNLAPL